MTFLTNSRIQESLPDNAELSTKLSTSLKRISESFIASPEVTNTIGVCTCICHALTVYSTVGVKNSIRPLKCV